MVSTGEERECALALLDMWLDGEQAHKVPEALENICSCIPLPAKAMGTVSGMARINFNTAEDEHKCIS
jgi:hypothetical protein